MCRLLMSAHYWDWVFHEGAGILFHIEQDPDGLQYKHILMYIMHICNSALS
jgi:hypothetical protein